jgi:hypothetical protein
MCRHSVVAHGEGGYIVGILWSTVIVIFERYESGEEYRSNDREIG